MARPRPNPITAHIHAAVEKIDSICGRARNDIRARLLEHIDEHPNSPWSYANVARLERTLTAMYQQWGASVNTVFDDFLPREYQAGYDRAKNELRKSGVWRNITGGPDMRRIRNALDSVYNNVALRTDKMTFDHIRQLRNFSAKVFREASITGETRRQVSERLQNEALQVPGFQFTDIAGRKWSHKSYFEMLARTELMNGARDSYEQECAEQGYNIMLLSVSGHCCEACARFEGKYFSIGPNRYGLPTKDDLEAAGVFHPNCTHSYSAVPDYIIEKEFGKAEQGKSSHPSRPSSPSVPSGKQSVPFGFWKGKNEQFAAKFDGNFTEQGKTLEKQMKKAGISAEVRDEIHWNHTPKMQKLCGENPHLKGGSNWPGTIPGTRNIEVGDDPTKWEGCRQTATHEYGHYVANSIFDLVKNRDFEEFKAAVVSDWTATMKKTELIKRFKGLADNWTAKEQMKDTLAKEKYGKDKYDELSLDQQWKITADADILGSISSGLYGFGHGSDVYIEDRYREAFANMYLVHKYNWNEFRERYPKLWKYMENLTK